jgi:hypothetical protein
MIAFDRNGDSMQRRLGAAAALSIEDCMVE